MLIGQDKKENNRVTVSLMRVQTVRTFHQQQNHEKNWKETSKRHVPRDYLIM